MMEDQLCLAGGTETLIDSTAMAARGIQIQYRKNDSVHCKGRCHGAINVRNQVREVNAGIYMQGQLSGK